MYMYTACGTTGDILSFVLIYDQFVHVHAHVYKLWLKYGGICKMNYSAVYWECSPSTPSYCEREDSANTANVGNVYRERNGSNLRDGLFQIW